MVTGDGGVALAGANILLIDDAGRIEQDYIFIG